MIVKTTGTETETTKEMDLTRRGFIWRPHEGVNEVHKGIYSEQVKQDLIDDIKFTNGRKGEN